MKIVVVGREVKAHKDSFNFWGFPFTCILFSLKILIIHQYKMPYNAEYSKNKW